MTTTKMTYRLDRPVENAASAVTIGSAWRRRRLGRVRRVLVRQPPPARHATQHYDYT